MTAEAPAQSHGAAAADDPACCGRLAARARGRCCCPICSCRSIASSHPVSTLMLWRWATGARVERICRAARAHGAGPAAHRDRRRGWALLQPSRHRSAAKSARRWSSRRYQRGARRLDHHPADRQEPVPVAGPQLRAQGAEFPLALWIDLVLPKRRIMEIYLNIAEWGPNGEFGAEAGARFAFGKSARDLDAREAACWPRSCRTRSAQRRAAGRPCAGSPASTQAPRRRRTRLRAGPTGASSRGCGATPSLGGKRSSISPAFQHIGVRPTTTGEPPWPSQNEKHRPRGAGCAVPPTRSSGRPMSRTRIPANCAGRITSTSRPACTRAARCSSRRPRPDCAGAGR